MNSNHNSDEASPVVEIVEDGPRLPKGPAFGAHLGGVRSVMLIAWHDTQHRFMTLPLRIFERTRAGQLIFTLPDPDWAALLADDYEVICLTAQVEDRFVSVEGTIDLVDEGGRQLVVVDPSAQTFWDAISGRVARVSSSALRERLDTPGSLQLDSSPNG